MDERRTISDWQGRDPSECPETFNDYSPTNNNEKDWHLFVGLAILMAVFFIGGYFMSKCM